MPYNHFTSNQFSFQVILILLLCASNGFASEHPYRTLYDIKTYKFDLEVTNINTNLSGNVKFTGNVLHTNDTFSFELTNLAIIDSILFNDEPTSFTHINNVVNIPDLTSDSSFAIQVYYSITNARFTDSRGILHRRTSNGKLVTWTITEPDYAYYWFPCKQDLHDKIDSATLMFTVDDSLMVGSNGLLKSVIEVEKDKKRFVWKTNYPTAFYLFSYAVANYIDYSFYVEIPNHDSLLVQNFVYNDSNLLLRNKPQIDITSNLMQLFSELFGTYPFIDEKYGHCLTPTGGGMEHQTMTTLGNFSFKLVTHELAHQWFGNSVTCSNWQDIWLNEGFATYTEYIAAEHLKPDGDQRSWLSEAHALVKSEEGGSVYIPDSLVDSYEHVFDYRTTYLKGALLIHMIRHRLQNDELFYRTLQQYLLKYKYSVASAKDFKEVLETNSGIDFTQFFEQWYYGEGYPIIDINWQQDEDSVYIEMVQESSIDGDNQAFELLLDFKIEHLGGDTLVSHLFNGLKSAFSFKCKSKVLQVNPNYNNASLIEVRSVQNRGRTNKHVQFTIYPNPALNKVYIENYLNELPFQAYLYNNSGLLIQHSESSDNYISFSLQKLRSGSYTIVARRQNNHEVFTLVKL